MVSVWPGGLSTKESLKVNAHTTIANAGQWKPMSGEVLSITTLPGKTSYSTGRAVRSWYANAEVAVNDDTVIVRLPDDEAEQNTVTRPYICDKNTNIELVTPGPMHG